MTFHEFVRCPKMMKTLDNSANVMYVSAALCTICGLLWTYVNWEWIIGRFYG